MKKRKRFLKYAGSIIVLVAFFVYGIYYKGFIPRKLNTGLLEKMIQGCTHYLMASQKKEGNFIYELNLKNGEITQEDNQVRQSGALWGLALAYTYKPTESVEEAAKRGLNFFFRHAVFHDSVVAIHYPGEVMASTGTTALLALTILDMMQACPTWREDSMHKNRLTYLINTLQYLKHPEGGFYSYYSVQNMMPLGSPNPYADGETLLALCKYYRLFPDQVFLSHLENSARLLYEHYVEIARKKQDDNALTKGFYQWGTMAFYELFEITGDTSYTEKILDLAHWMIDVHKTLRRTKNTAYAYEGLATAYRCALLTGRLEDAEKIKKVIHRGFFRLITWQYAGPRENLYLLFTTNKIEQAQGGVMNSCCNPLLRIDVTQHQLHAGIRILRFVLKEN